LLHRALSSINPRSHKV